MKSKKLMDIIKTNDLIIPSILLKNYKDLKMNEKELLLTALLMSYNNPISFDPASFSSILGLEINEVIETISSLSTKKYIEMIVKKENGKMKEYLSLDLIYEKLLLTVIEEEEQKEEESMIYSIIESELGKPITALEYEIIGDWLNAGIKEDLIKEAVKEAVFSGVRNLKYIDKILANWIKQGYKNASDVKKKNKKKEPEIVETYDDFDWLNDD